ncbi:PKD domain-containing protein [Candidatus Gracilibacteria bacterium]|nr:PKD domain-containing protein [Candidatus Gracilibacteria bacterium]
MNTTSAPLFGIDIQATNTAGKRRSRAAIAIGLAFMSLAGIFSFLPQQTTLAAGNATSFLLSIEGKTDDISIEANKAFSLTVKALDNDLATATGYTGTVVINATDSRARLPAQYTFTAADRGEKRFDLALTLLTPGNQTVTVKDNANAAITGEVTMTITAGTTNNTADSTKPVILTPTNDSTVNRAQLDITGTSAPNVQVSIYDNDKLLGTVNADTTGRFSYSTDSLTDGTHTLRAAVVNSQGVKTSSTTVQVRVDTAPPILQSVTVNPLEVEGTQKATITVNTEPELTSVKATADQRAITLAPVAGKPGSYSGEFIAPQAPGLYPVDIEVTDKFNNTSKYRAQATIKVKAAVVAAANILPTASVSASVQTGRAPLTVNFKSQAADSDGRIVSYLWNFGDGKTSTEANPTHIYDTEGNFTVNLTVTDDKGGSTTTTLQGKDITAQPQGEVTQSGPELWVAVLAAVAVGFFASRRHATR